MKGWIGRLGCMVALGAGVGCVPLSDYQALEKRFGEQETYVTKHKNEVREMERREQVLTLRSREQEKQLELLRARLEKSERLRQREGTSKEETVAASAPRQSEPPPQMMGLQVNPETQGLVLESGVMFASGSADLTPKGRQILDGLLKELNSPRYAGQKIRVDGHTDDEPIQRTKGQNQSNWELAGRRALSVLHYLEGHGVSSSRLSFGGFGQYRPFDKGKGNTAKAKNRRVEIVLFQQ